jgi:hypothetical protein
VTAPAQALEINGNIKIDTTGHGITYPDGTVQTTASIPGTGTITAVTAGTDLTGGGTSGKVVLDLDTTKVPTLAATSNTFTGSGGITATSFTGSGAGITNVNAAYLGGVAASGYAQVAAENFFTYPQNITGTGSGYVLEAINNYTGSGSSAIYAMSAGANATAIYGEADNGTAAGIKGLSTSATGVYGVYNAPSTSGAGEIKELGVWADTNGSNTTALLATADNSVAGTLVNNSQLTTLYLQNTYSGTAEVFQTTNAAQNEFCSIDTNANLSCNGTITGSVRTRDERNLEMYSVQSTENWYEDFGTGQLKDGVAKVTLDADFADLANTGIDYHVFLTPRGDSEGLYVTNQEPNSFEVRESKGGHASIAFDYRIVAKRKGKESLRMQDVTEQVKARKASYPQRRKGGNPPPALRKQPTQSIPRLGQQSSLTPNEVVSR